MSAQRCALIMAGGTGGHIFPGLAVAKALSERGWSVHWIGGASVNGRVSMESELVPAHGVPFHSIEFSGLRGKGFNALVMLPWRLLKAFWQSFKVLRLVKPDVVVGFGGYVTFPAGLMTELQGCSLVLHEQNSVAGLTNKVLATVADKVLTGFPGVMKKAQWVGNPLRASFFQQAQPQVRFAGRTGPLKLLVIGGSLGAKALNEIVPQALALIPLERRPLVMHQSGANHIQALSDRYKALGVQAELTAFIDDTAQVFAQADLIICRSGAGTVSEIAAVGAAAVFVPFPFAVDDHQTHNAQFLVDQGGGCLMQQKNLTAEGLALMLQKTEREELLKWAIAAKKMQKMNATQDVVLACEELLE